MTIKEIQEFLKHMNHELGVVDVRDLSESSNLSFIHLTRFNVKYISKMMYLFIQVMPFDEDESIEFDDFILDFFSLIRFNFGDFLNLFLKHYDNNFHKEWYIRDILEKYRTKEKENETV